MDSVHESNKNTFMLVLFCANRIWKLFLEQANVHSLKFGLGFYKVPLEFFAVACTNGRLPGPKSKKGSRNGSKCSIE